VEWNPEGGKVVKVEIAIREWNLWLKRCASKRDQIFKTELTPRWNPTCKGKGQRFREAAKTCFCCDCWKQSLNIWRKPRMRANGEEEIRWKHRGNRFEVKLWGLKPEECMQDGISLRAVMTTDLSRGWENLWTGSYIPGGLFVSSKRLRWTGRNPGRWKTSILNDWRENPVAGWSLKKEVNRVKPLESWKRVPPKCKNIWGSIEQIRIEAFGANTLKGRQQQEGKKSE